MNPNLYFGRRRIHRLDCDATVLGSELDAILDQVPKDLLQTSWVRFDIRMLGAQIELNPELFGARFFTTNLECPLDDLVQGNRLQGELQFAFGDSSHVEQIIDQPRFQFDVPP